MSSPSISLPAPRHRLGVTLMLVSAASFTANVLLVRALGQVETVNVWLVSCVRFLSGLAVIFAVYRREFAFTHLFRNPKLIGRGAVGGIGVYAFYLTVVHLGAGRATFISNTYVIFGALMAVWALGERFTAALAVGAVATIAGLGLLTNPFASGASASLYDGLAVLTSLASAYIVVTIRQLHATEHTSTIFGAQCVYGLIICAIPALLPLREISVSPLGWGLMTLAGLFAAIGQIAMTRGFRELPVAEGSLLQMLVPLGIAVGGMVFFHEHFTSHELIGAGLILGGTAYTAWRR